MKELLKVNFATTSTPKKTVLTGQGDMSGNWRTPGMVPSTSYVESLLTLYRAFIHFNGDFRAKLNLKLELPEPDLSHGDPNSALILSEIKLLSDTYFEVYDGGPMESHKFYKDKLNKLLQSFKTQSRADFEGAFIPFIVNKTEDLLGTMIFVKLLEKATTDNLSKTLAISLINKIFYSYKQELRYSAGKPQGEQNFAEPLALDRFILLPAGCK